LTATASLANPTKKQVKSQRSKVKSQKCFGSEIVLLHADVTRQLHGSALLTFDL
jgi:hypothetical protein